MIPDFEEELIQPQDEPKPYRVLPVGVHECAEPEFAERFVGDYPASQSRRLIWQGFARLRREAVEQNIAGHQWVAGSFTTSKENPGDVDVVTFTDYEAFNQFSPTQEEFFKKKLDGRKGTHLVYKSHTFAVLSCPPEHPYYPVFKIARDKWLKWFGKTRPLIDTQSEYPRGLVALPLGDGLEYSVTSG